jgi:hypothetical protein
MTDNVKTSIEVKPDVLTKGVLASVSAISTVTLLEENIDKV